MELPPATPRTASVLRGSPLALTNDREARAIDDQVNALLESSDKTILELACLAAGYARSTECLDAIKGLKSRTGFTVEGARQFYFARTGQMTDAKKIASAKEIRFRSDRQENSDTK